MSAGSSISVALRVRPLGADYISHLAQFYAHPLTLGCDDHAGTKIAVRDADLGREIIYNFPTVYGQQTTNDEIYYQTVSPIVSKALSGGAGALMAYGQTASGKTYTMFGTKDTPGLVSLALRDVYKTLPTAQVLISCIEIYCEQVFDLLSPIRHSLDVQRPLRLCEMGGRVVPAGASVAATGSLAEAEAVVAWGAQERRQASTAANSVSSRSHAILLVQIEGAGNLLFADLAGSEGGGNERRAEAKNINRSLLALSNCIQNIAKRSTDPTPTPSQSVASFSTVSKIAPKSNFVSFRDSKLTYLLKDALSGFIPSALIVCLTPAAAHRKEALNSIRYAAAALRIRPSPPPPRPTDQLAQLAAQRAARKTACSQTEEARAGAGGGGRGVDRGTLELLRERVFAQAAAAVEARELARKAADIRCELREIKDSADRGELPLDLAKDECRRLIGSYDQAKKAAQQAAQKQAVLADEIEQMMEEMSS